MKFKVAMQNWPVGSLVPQPCTGVGSSNWSDPFDPAQGLAEERLSGRRLGS